MAVPTAARGIDLAGIAHSCGYDFVAEVTTEEQLRQTLKDAKENIENAIPSVSNALSEKGMSYSQPSKMGSCADGVRLSNGGLSFIAVNCALGSRSDLGRPTISPIDSKRAFMDYLGSLN